VDPLLEARAISRSFGGVQALDRIELSVNGGEVLGLIGPNGAGKTTLFNVICGLRPTAGRVLFKGEDITGLPPHQICRRGIARTFQLTRPFAELSVRDNIAAAVLFGRNPRRVSGLDEARRAADLVLSSVKLDRRKEARAGELLFSERRRLELARALATSPELLLLDEVMAGLTPIEAQQAVAVIRRIRERGVTVLLIDHVMSGVRDLADRVAVLNFGRKIAEGTFEEVAHDPGVIEAYLGEEEGGVH